MGAEIIPFDFAAGHALRLHRPVSRPGREYTFPQVVRLLALGDLAPRTQVDHLRRYADGAGMPLPKNLRCWGGEVMRGAAAIGARSVWCALEFDAWLARGRTPPPTADALDPLAPALPPERRTALRNRAAQLARGLG